MSTLAKDAKGNVAQICALGSSQNVTIGASSLQSTAMAGTTQIVRLAPTADCFISVGQNPTATTSSTLMLAGQIEYIAVTPGQRIAVIQSSGGGTLNITEAA